MQEAEVALLSFDRALGTRASVHMRLPKFTVSWDECVKAIVLLRVGVDDAAIRRIGTAVGKMGARGDRRSFPGSSQRATPLDAQAIRAKAILFHRKIGCTDGNVFFKSQGASISQVVPVALIERDDEGHTPTGSGQAEVPNGIVSSIQGSSLDRKPTGLSCVVEGDKGVNGIVAVAVSDGDHQGKLAAMLEGVRG